MEIEGYKLIDVEEAYTLGVLGVPIYYKYKSSSKDNKNKSNNKW